MRSVGVDARVATLHAMPSSFGYREDWVFDRIGDEAAMRDWARPGVDWLLSAGDGAYDVLHAEVPRIKHRFFGVLHAGSAYRSGAAGMNAHDRKLGARVRFIGSDSLHLSDDGLPAHPYWAVAERWRSPAEARGVDALHATGNPYSKGSATLLAGARLAGIEPVCLGGVTHDCVLEAMGFSRVYLDQINAGIGGFGCAAVEAAAMGCAVVADMRKVPHAAWAPPFQRVTTEESVSAAVGNALADASHAQRCHAWAREFAAPDRVAERITKLLAEAAA